jgi:hypothetical protein
MAASAAGPPCSCSTIRTLLLSLLLALVAAVALPPAASASLRIGIAENNYGLFDDPIFQRLGVADVRVVAPFDVMRRGGFARDRLTQYLLRAHAAGIRPLVTFEHSEGGASVCRKPRAWHKRQCRLPTGRTYERDLRRFFRAFPWVRQIAPWNEANHYTQPTSRDPAAAARFANTVHRVCPRCTIVLADVLDQADPGTTTNRVPRYFATEAWIRRYRKVLKVPRRVCGLHNYSDINRFRSTGTVAVIRALGCRQIWLTEAGGIYSFPGFSPSPKRQLKATKYLFKIARSIKRVKRVYVYNYFGGVTPRFDAGLVAGGVPRPAFGEVVKQTKAKKAKPKHKSRSKHKKKRHHRH